MRQCGKRYATKDEAEHSKKGSTGHYLAVSCRCEGWHLEKLLLKPIPSGTYLGAVAKPAASKGESFSPAVCALIDARDGDDSGAVLVRLCQRCGSARNLHRHHRRLKQKGGSSNRPHTHCACNAVTVCLACHGEIHDQASREQMEAEGWIVSQAVDEPGSVGVMRFAAAEGGATQWPDCLGNWLQAAPEAMEAA